MIIWVRVTGAADVCLDPRDPRIVYAAMYDCLTIAGIGGVLLAAFVVKSLPLTLLKWVVVVVIVYTSVTMFRSVGKRVPAEAAPEAVGGS